MKTFIYSDKDGTHRRTAKSWAEMIPALRELPLPAPRCGDFIRRLWKMLWPLQHATLGITRNVITVKVFSYEKVR